MDSQVILSFSNWPGEGVKLANYKLSPISSKLIKSTNVEVELLLPVSVEEFILDHNLSMRSKEDIEEMYREQTERRTKKVQILKSLWDRVSLKHRKRKSQHLSDFLKKERMSLSQRNSSKSSLFRKNQKPSPIIFKVRSPKKNSAYFDYYSNSKDGKLSMCKNKYSHEDQSTKSRRNTKQKLNSKFSPNKDYFGSQQKKNHRKKIKNDTTIKTKKTQICLELLDKMNIAMQKWTQLDGQHRQEVNEMMDLTEREKKRLLKIQLIQKQKLKQQIQEIKTSLTASKQLGKYLF